MATTPASITAAARGIAKTLTGFVIQDYTITNSPIVEQVPDQYGAIAEEQVYDHRTDLSLTCISASSSRTAPVATNDILAFDSSNWMVDSIAEAGTYNGVMRFTITAHKYTNFPSQS